ncbi:YgaP family membrane protein [Brevibacillus panacihumi]|uniref:DUF2892 domain-containing protein n=1 Tax=Brevibacillus panacihumi TaxID=497735 RepID=A0A3M8BXV8_9BACL|nr:DUF2892 domain-containing protein [Brevibacillus panacihumi]RNB68256.1 DUF2892 domain-containing protein [Brevibacillus panacihumi]
MKNVGLLDRIIRLISGIALLSMLVFVNGTWKYVGLLGIPLILTGVLGMCLVYRILGVHTCSAKV